MGTLQYITDLQLSVEEKEKEEALKTAVKPRTDSHSLSSTLSEACEESLFWLDLVEGQETHENSVSR